MRFITDYVKYITIGISFMLCVSLSYAQSTITKSTYDSLERRLCLKKERIRSGNIIEKRTLTNSYKESLGKPPAIDTFKFKFVILDNGRKFAWSSEKNKDILQFDGKIYLIKHYSKTIIIETDSTSEYFENLNYGISNDFIKSNSCNSENEFEILSFQQSEYSIECELFKEFSDSNSQFKSVRIHKKIRDSINWFRNIGLDAGGIVYKMKYELVEHQLSKQSDSNIIEQMSTYINNMLSKYSIIEGTVKSDKMDRFDSSIIASNWEFYDLDSLPIKIDQNIGKILIFSFIGCVGCTWIKKDIGTLLYTTDLKIPVYVINVYDPIFKIREQASKEKWNFKYLTTDIKYLKSNFDTSGFPTVMIIDKNGRVVYRKTGYNGKDIDVINQTLINNPFF